MTTAAHAYIETRLQKLLARNSGGVAYANLIQSARGITRVTSDDTSGVSSDGTVSTTEYGINLTLFDALIGGTHGRVAALADQDLLADVDAFDLDGKTDGVAAVADLNSVWIVCVCVLQGSTAAPKLYFIFGRAALTAEVERPDESACRVALCKALKAGSITDYKDSGLGLVVCAIKVDRAGGVTLVHEDPAADTAIGHCAKQKRLAGALC